MLARIETLYLNLLRVFIIVLATLALAASILLSASAIPSLFSRIGETKADTSTLTLSRFVSEQRPTAEVDTENNFDAPVDPKIARAASNVKLYLAARSTIPLKTLEEIFTKSQNTIPAVTRADYGDSLLKLSEELKESKGKPLSENRVMGLLSWHESRFASEWEKEAALKAEADAAFKFRLLAASAAFIAFVMIIFIFLFVRVERNTRLVHVVRISDDA